LNSPRIPQTYLLPCGTSVEFTKNTSNTSSSVWHECWIHQEYLKHIFFHMTRVLNSPRISHTYLLPCGTSVEFTKNISNIYYSVVNSTLVPYGIIYVWDILGEFNIRATRKKTCLRYSWWMQHSCHTETDIFEDIIPYGTSVEFTKNTSKISVSVWHECCIHQEYLKHVFFRVARMLNLPRISQNHSSLLRHECWTHQEYLKHI
jgi:hypothetical protein